MTTLNLRKSAMSQAIIDANPRKNSLSAAYASAESPASAGTQVSEIQPLDLRQPLPKEVFEEVKAEVEQTEGIEIPLGWSKGALLNVRNRGDHYVITLYPEEWDPRHPERAMTFPNTWTCQDFVSRWYARENPDPRAR